MLDIEKIAITQPILTLVAEIDEFKGSWNALERHTTALQLLGDVAHFGRSFKEVLEPWRNKQIDDDLVKKLHGFLNGSKQASEYKTESMALIIQNDDQIYGSLDVVEASEVRSHMEQLLSWVHGALQEERYHPLLVIAVFTISFLRIAPFKKGNQKLVRLLIILLMFRSGYLYAPYAQIDSFIEERMRDYFEVLKFSQEAIEQGQEDLEPWSLFFLMVLRDQARSLKEKIEKRGDQLAEMPSLSVKILKMLDEAPRISMKEIEEQTGGKRSTIKLRISELLEGGYIKRHGKARATWYSKV